MYRWLVLYQTSTWKKKQPCNFWWNWPHLNYFHNPPLWQRFEGHSHTASKVNLHRCSYEKSSSTRVQHFWPVYLLNSQTSITSIWSFSFLNPLTAQCVSNDLWKKKNKTLRCHFSFIKDILDEYVKCVPDEGCSHRLLVYRTYCISTIIQKVVEISCGSMHWICGLH